MPVNLLEEESDPDITAEFQKILDRNTAALELVAPYQPAKISPTKEIMPSIGLIEELNIEDVIYKLRESKIENLVLVINSFGGGVSSSFKIAYALRKNFAHITTVIPHIAASGGTLIALCGNEIVMGDLSSITPIDVQLLRNGAWFSVNSMVRSFNALNNLFSDTSEEDAPYPWKAMANKLDPVEFQEWVDASNLMVEHSKIILGMNSSFKKDVSKIISRLTTGYPTHSYAITLGEAQTIFEDHIHDGVGSNNPFWDVSRQWIKKYVLSEKSSNHIIRYILPAVDEEEVEKANSEAELEA